MDIDPQKLQALAQAVHSAIEALDELTFLLHSAAGSDQARDAQAQAQAVLDRARLTTNHPRAD